MKNLNTLFVAVICTSISFVSFSQNDIPLVDENGDYIITVNENGAPSFVYPDPIEAPIQNGIPLVDENGDYIIRVNENGAPSFVYPDLGEVPSTPLVDENGNVIVVTLEDGTKSFVYPPKEIE